jgi:predicted P-loop ATPase
MRSAALGDAHSLVHAISKTLVDDTGNRRFYPVRIPDGVQIDIEWLRANVGQLTAEAAHLETAGETFYRCSTLDRDLNMLGITHSAITPERF